MNPKKNTQRRGMLVLAGLLLATALAVPAVAQDEEAAEAAPAVPPEMMEAMMKAMTPAEPHQAMASDVGTFKLSMKSWTSPDSEPMMMEGTATREMIMDGRVLHEAVESSFMGQPFRGEGRTGYDNVTGEYWSTWIDSMNTGMWHLIGNSDGDSGVLTFGGDVSDAMSGGKKRMKVVIHPEKDGHQMSEFFEVNGDESIKMMEITYSRAE